MSEMQAESWPSPGALTLSLPEGFRIEQLARAEVPDLITDLHAWCPNLVDSDPALLAPAFYDEAVALRDEEGIVGLRPVLVLVLLFGERPVAYVVLAYEMRGRALLVQLFAIHPEHRDRGIGTVLAQTAIQVGRAMDGVDTVYAAVALDDRVACANLEGSGMGLCAILPNVGRRRVGDAVRYAPEVVFGKVLVPEERIVWPAPEALRPKPAALLAFLHGGGDPPASVGIGEEVRPLPLPVFDPALAAALAGRPGSPDTWPDFGAVTATLDLPPGVTLRQLGRADIPAVIELLPAWYPTIVGSMLSFLLTPEFYEESVALAGEDTSVERRRGFVHLAEVDGVPALFVLHTFDTFRGRVLRSEFGVADPSQRRSGLAGHILPLSVLVGRALEADTIMAWATLLHPYAQRLVERQDFALSGIFPASERLTVAPGVVKHAFEAFYTCSLVPEEQTFWPPFSAMPERVAALARFVRGERV